jgi:hypothetical protein
MTVPDKDIVAPHSHWGSLVVRGAGRVSEAERNMANNRLGNRPDGDQSRFAM